VPRIFGLFSRIRPPHALSRSCGIVVRRRVLFAGRPFARPASRGEVPGFFALAAETPILRVTWTRFSGGTAVTNSLRPSAGGANERGSASGACCHPATRSNDPLVVAPASQGLDPAIHEAGLTLRGLGIPRAFHGLDLGSIKGQLLFAGHHERGACAGLSTFACPEHPCCEGSNHRSRPERWSSLRWTSRPRIALRRSSVAADKMPRIRFYNRRSRHEHPSETSLSETARRAPWETRRRSTSRPLCPGLSRGFRFRVSSGAGPPCGHPTSNGFAFDGASPASGSSTTSFFRGRGLPYVARAACVRRRRPGFFGRRYLCRFEPSDTSHGRPDKDPRRSAPVFRSHDPASAVARQCRRLLRDRGVFHRVRPPRGPSRALAWCAVPAGRRRQVLHVFIEVP